MSVVGQLDELKRVLDEQLVEYYTELDADGNFVHPPKTDDQLDEFIQAAYGLRLPRKVVTPGHRTPFEFVADLFFERTKNALGFANRTGGKTYGVALLNHLDMTFKPGCEIASAGAVRDQAEKCYRYLQEHLERPWFKKLRERFQKIKRKDLVESSIRSMTKFNNGSILEIITATEKGLRGPHPQKSRIDEVDEIEWELLQTGLSMSHSTDDILGQNVFTSTRQKMHGSMQRMLDEAVARGIEIYEWNIWETLQTCNRRCKGDPKHGDCPIYTFCQGKAHHCDGFYRIDDFIEKVRMIDREKFETEWLNEKPSKERFVYPNFSQTRHVLTPEKLQELCGFSYPNLSWQKISSIDFGSSPGHPFVHLDIFRIPNVNAWLVFEEYVAEQRLLRDHADSIKRKKSYRAGDCPYADHDAQDRLELKNYGINTRKAIKGNASVAVGIDYIKSLLSGFPPLETPMLYVWHECTYTIKEFGMYSWPIRPDGKPDKSGRPLQENDHAMDALRYALYSYHRSSGSRYTARSMPGV